MKFSPKTKALTRYMVASTAFALATVAITGIDLPISWDKKEIQDTAKKRVEQMPEGFHNVVFTSFNGKSATSAHLTFDAKLKTDAGDVPYIGEADCGKKSCSLVTLRLK